MAHIKQTDHTREIHRQIITICQHLKTSYRSKKHGGYNIYEDDKIYMQTDTYVSNVDCEVILLSGTKECVFSAAYGHASINGGNPSTYHAGKWESYLRELWEKALLTKEETDKASGIKEDEAQKLLDHRASGEADSVFS